MNSEFNLQVFQVKSTLRGFRMRLRALSVGKLRELNQVLRDEEMLNAVVAETLGRYFLAKGFGNPLIDLLEWIMDNWEVILEIIMTIIDLFTRYPQEEATEPA